MLMPRCCLIYSFNSEVLLNVFLQQVLANANANSNANANYQMALLSHGGDANDGGNSENVKEALTSGVQHSPRLHSIPHVLWSID